MLYVKTLEKLARLEQELKAQSLWSVSPPSPEAMSDTAPFCCTSMAFEQWVQFIFIPKMHALIAAQDALPSNIAIAPMAHHVWDMDKQRHVLIMIFDDLDNFLREQR